jgi:hypothetical protein
MFISIFEEYAITIFKGQEHTKKGARAAALLVT